MSKDRYIEDLVEKFLDGRTTNAEEQELYAWFATADVPDEWTDLKAMFAWYREGMPEMEGATESVSRPKPRFSLTMRRAIIAVASAVAVVLVAIMLWPSSREMNIYEGSYIIEQGSYCDNIEYIKDDIEALLERADELEHKSQELLALAD